MRAWSPERVAEAAGARLGRPGAGDTGPTRAVIDSRAIEPGDLFVGLVGEHVDGRRFAAQALADGAWGVLVGPAHADVDGDGQLDLAVFEGASSGLLDDDDLADAGGVLEPGSSAGILVYENVWAAPFAAALRRGGGQLVASGRIPVQALLAAVDRTESVESSSGA